MAPSRLNCRTPLHAGSSCPWGDNEREALIVDPSMTPLPDTGGPLFWTIENVFPDWEKTICFFPISEMPAGQGSADNCAALMLKFQAPFNEGRGVSLRPCLRTAPRTNNGKMTSAT